ncbi:MAG TPA: carbon-nitrogen hydrolase family protein [Bacteroidales bacterium]|nr:carbon-nitrogen hydrolase family protein [Bacteroidales bacterium]
MTRYVFIILSLIISSPLRSQNLVPNNSFEIQKGNLPDGWSEMYPRAEIAPEFSTDNSVSHSGKHSAKISAKGSIGTYGYLQTSFTGIESGSSKIRDIITLADSDFLGTNNYVISGYFRTSTEVNPEKNIRIKITWLDKNSNELLTEFISDITTEKGWHRFTGLRAAPLNAAGMNIRLILQWAGSGSVWWDDLHVEKAPASLQRHVVIATASSWPNYPSTTEKNLKFYSEMISEAGNKGADIICLGEGITTVSTGKSYSDAAEPVPGPTTKILGDAARKAGIYVVAGIYEREGSLIYNTAVLLDRKGEVAGRYRKTHLPQTEVEGGLTPGDTYPVFKTDFGTIGMEICYDNFFPEVAHQLTLNGAEIIFCPIAGDIRGLRQEWSIVARARAIDNAVFFTASMYEKRGSLIIDPNGVILQDTGNSDGYILSKVNLGMRTFEKWLSNKSFGEWKKLMPNEIRPETY